MFTNASCPLLLLRVGADNLQHVPGILLLVYHKCVRFWNCPRVPVLPLCVGVFCVLRQICRSGVVCPQDGGPCQWCLHVGLLGVYHLHLSVFRHLYGIYDNYRLITLIFKKCGNLSLCLENCALFSLLLIFTTILYKYPLRYIIYLGEPSGNIISNYHDTFIHIYMYWYDPIFKKIYETLFFPRLILPFFGSLFFLANNTSITI